MKNNKGFSLVELIIVIAIMAILVGVMAPQLIKYIEKTRQSADTQLCDSVRTALITAASDPDVAKTQPTETLANGSGMAISAALNSQPTITSAYNEIMGAAAGAESGMLKSNLCKGNNILVSVNDNNICVYVDVAPTQIFSNGGAD